MLREGRLAAQFTPRLPSRSIPAPVYFGSWDIYEVGEASCPSGFEGQLKLRLPRSLCGEAGPRPGPPREPIAPETHRHSSLGG